MLNRSVQYLKGVGEARAKLLQKLKIETVGDLLNHFPRAYEDRSRVIPIQELTEDESVCVCAEVTSPVSSYRGSGGRPISKFTISDDTGSLQVTFFNAKYLNVSQGQTYRFYGKAERLGRRFFLTNPVMEPPDSHVKTGRILPVYALTEGLPNATLIRMMESALSGISQMPETLPPTLIEKFALMDIREAYRQIHAPQDTEKLAQARRRLAFEELFTLSLGLALVKTDHGERGEALPPQDMSPFYAALPFALTGAQRRAIDEVLTDMTSPAGLAMRRMVQGDVGSGKTMVAAAAAYAAARGGAQSAMMAPTEILARQHYAGLSALLQPLGVRVGLLTAGMPAPARRDVLERLAAGEIDFIIGTHALITENVQFSRLRLVITDEQHRFGVRQRALLREKAEIPPHMLVMSATPIPRTLAMVLYGDMDLSVIDELPPGRLPIDTRAPTEEYRDAVYGFMRRQLDRGRQAYVVCPVIDESENEDLKAASAFAEELQARYFAGYRVALLHGRLSAREKDAVMEAFAAGEVQVLVATTVVEVGVNVPNANMIVIENAERFGLSQLHQLRGRVGRSDKKSYCVLLTQSASQTTRERLEVMCRTNDGFEIAREDLRIRGPGEFFGQRQSGVPGLRIAELGADMKLLSDAHDAALALLAQDPQLSAPENAVLRSRITTLLESERT